MSDLEAHVVLSSISPIPKQRTNKSSQRETFIWTVGDSLRPGYTKFDELSSTVMTLVWDLT